MYAIFSVYKIKHGYVLANVPRQFEIVLLRKPKVAQKMARNVFAKKHPTSLQMSWKIFVATKHPTFLQMSWKIFVATKHPTFLPMSGKNLSAKTFQEWPSFPTTWVRSAAPPPLRSKAITTGKKVIPSMPIKTIEILKTRIGMHLCMQGDQNGQKTSVLPPADKTPFYTIEKKLTSKRPSLAADGNTHHHELAFPYKGF
jgi:hypothetical protein